MRVLIKRHLTCWAAATMAVGSLGSAAPAAGQEPVVVNAPSPIAAYQNRLVWSRPDGAGGFALVQRVGDGPIVPLRVPSRSVPFDVDLGPTSGGRVLAVYSRCATEPSGKVFGIPEYQTGRGCDVYKLDLERGHESRYTTVNASTASEFWPTYWKGRLGFARVYDGDPRTPPVYVKEIAGSRPSERLPGGPGGVCARRPAACTAALRPVPLHLELYGSRLAFAWHVPDARGDRYGRYEVRVDTVGSSGDHVVVDRSSSGALTALLLGWPAFENGRVFWARQCFVDTSGCVRMRRRLSKGTYTGDLVELGAPSPQFVMSHERAAGITWVLRDAIGAADCQGEPPKPAGACALEPLRPAYAALD